MARSANSTLAHRNELGRLGDAENRRPHVPEFVPEREHGLAPTGPCFGQRRAFNADRRRLTPAVGRQRRVLAAPARRGESESSRSLRVSWPSGLSRRREPARLRSRPLDTYAAVDAPSRKRGKQQCEERPSACADIAQQEGAAPGSGRLSCMSVTHSASLLGGDGANARRGAGREPTRRARGARRVAIVVVRRRGGSSAGASSERRCRRVRVPRGPTRGSGVPPRRVRWRPRVGGRSRS